MLDPRGLCRSQKQARPHGETPRIGSHHNRIGTLAASKFFAPRTGVPHIGTPTGTNAGSAEHPALGIGAHFRLAHTDQVAEHELVVAAEAGRGADDIARYLFEVEAGEAIGLVADFRVSAHAPVLARGELRIA